MSKAQYRMSHYSILDNKTARIKTPTEEANRVYEAAGLLG
jgi:hypothetical protein